MDAYRDWLERMAPNQQEWMLLSSLADRLRDDLPSYFKDLDRAADPHEEIRKRIAYARVLGPLVATYHTGGIELAWSELQLADEKKLRRYLKTAVSAEVILLDRPHSARRASMVPSFDVLSGLHDWPDDPE